MYICIYIYMCVHIYISYICIVWVCDTSSIDHPDI